LVHSMNLVNYAPRITASTCVFHKVWLPRTSFSETGMRFMAVDIELDDDIVGCELIDAMEEVPLITM
jgi:hypothetical protein